MTSGQSPQRVLATMYDEGAAAYSRYWAPALHRHATELVAAVPRPAPTSPRTVVDVATGSGELVPALRALAGAGGTVIALDRSLGMLRRAPTTAARVQADAAVLPMSSSSADVVVLAFVLFLLPDARQAVTEAARVLRPGGWLLAATWGSQRETGADAVVREELDASGAPEFPALARSDDLTNSGDRMVTLLGDQFRDVRCWSRPLNARFTAESALALRTGFGVLGWRYAHLDRGARADVTTRIARRLGSLPDDAYVDRSEVLLTTARRLRG